MEHIRVSVFIVLEMQNSRARGSTNVIGCPEVVLGGNLKFEICLRRRMCIELFVML